MAHFIGAVVVFALRGGRLLAMRRSPRKDAAPGAWEALSGRILPGEQPLEAAIRETREESGLEISIEPHPITAYQAKRIDEDMIVVAYRGWSEVGEVTLSEEHDHFAWMSLQEFASACRFPALVEAARIALRG
jgi:8-oxo-dGTP pyrophosphatase MutT (NUDIX family)